MTTTAPRARASSGLDPSALSRYLRTGSDPDLLRRRAVVGLSLLGLAAGQVVAAFQVGLLRRLPDPPGPFASARVDSSDYAYRRAGTPDAFMMLVSYATTAALAGGGGPDRPAHAPVLPLALAAKVVGDVATTVVLARQEWAENRALCAYCQAATLASVLSVPLVLPEARRAWRSLRRR